MKVNWPTYIKILVVTTLASFVLFSIASKMFHFIGGWLYGMHIFNTLVITIICAWHWRGQLYDNET